MTYFCDSLMWSLVWLAIGYLWGRVELELRRNRK